jgi:hypothetical protein
MFLHGGAVHLLGNMYFLWVFGDNVEDRLGIGEYLALYLAGGVAADLVQIAVNPGSTIPTVGASGAISAIMGAYVYLFPARRMYAMFFYRLYRVPVWIYLGIYMLFQFISALGALGGDGGGVAWWAHIGGFAFGAAAAALHRAVVRRRIVEGLAAPDDT